MPEPDDIYTRANVAQVLNEVADRLIETVPDSEDLCNVFVNVTLSRLADPNLTLRQAIEENWEEGADVVLGWLS